MKWQYVAAGVALVMLWGRGQQKKATNTQLVDTIASQQGSDWIGSGGLYAMWDRLSGSDLVAKNYPNIDASTAQADPGKVGMIKTGLVPGWNGSLG